MKKLTQIILIFILIGGFLLSYLIISEEMFKNFNLYFILFTFYTILQILGSSLALKNKLIGYEILIFVVFFQVIMFGINGFVFLLTTGPVIAVKYDLINNILGLDLSIFQIAFNIKPSNEYSFVSINFVSLFVLIFLINKYIIIKNQLK